MAGSGGQDLGYDHRRIKEREKALFGTAADDGRGGNQQSKVRLALAHWHEGSCKSWPAGERLVTHPEFKDRKTGRPRQVGSELYLGHGPLIYQRGIGTRLKDIKNNAALQAGEDNQLKLALPEDEQVDLQRAITLAHWFGTIGGRSRNGWGSLLWQAEGNAALPALSCAALESSGCCRALRDCLALDWPHAIGHDGQPLVWCSRETFADWREAIKFLAQTKIAFRTHFVFKTGKNSPSVEPRHVLAYPVTNHSVDPWGNNVRLANTLRFKLHREGEALRALIYHTPCKPTLPHGNVNLFETWQQVHRFLDADPKLARLA